MFVVGWFCMCMITVPIMSTLYQPIHETITTSLRYKISDNTAYICCFHGTLGKWLLSLVSSFLISTATLSSL